MNIVVRQTEILQNLYTIIYNKFIMISREIKNIFKKYTFNQGKKSNSNKSYDNKLVKHQPKRFFLSFEEINLLFEKNVSNNVSYTFLNRNINKFKKYIKNTILRRINTFKLFYKLKNKENLIKSNLILNNNVELGLSYRNDLNKYEGIEITREFPEFSDKYRIYFDIVYKIKTENFHHFLMMDKNLNKNFLCEYILICIKDKKYNIMFSSTKNLLINKNQTELLYNTIN